MGWRSRSPPSASALDQFHVGGLHATAELARRVGVSAGLKVLDAGSGLGGLSRYLAGAFGCDVIGVDLAPAYVRVAELLAERAGLTGKVRYQVGSITELPFEDSQPDGSACSRQATQFHGCAKQR